MNPHAKFDVSSSNHSRNMEGVPRISKVGHVTFFEPFDLILHYFCQYPWWWSCMPNLTVPDIWRGLKIWKVGHVTPSRPVNVGRRWPDIWIPRPRFAYSLYNFYGTTMTIKFSLPESIPIVKAFLADFWSKIWLGHVTCK